jgi:hypothetical protein
MSYLNGMNWVAVQHDGKALPGPVPEPLRRNMIALLQPPMVATAKYGT